MKLQHNDAIEFIFAMNRFGIRNKDMMIDYPGMEELVKWCDEYEKKLSPFLLNDISLICEKTIIITLYWVVKVSEAKNVNNAEDFLELIEKISPQELKNDIVGRFLEDSIENVTKDKVYNQILNDGLHIGYDTQEETDLICALISDTENFLSRLIITYKQFYKLVYLPSKNQFKDEIDKKYHWHCNKLEEDNISYLKILGMTSFLKAKEDLNTMSFYYSYFADNDVSILWDSRTIAIGAATDNRIIQQSAMKQSDLFFSLLGDQKRLEILRLTSKRPWYSSELATYFDLKPATLSYHINKLVDADLLTITKGPSKRFYYSLNEDSFKRYLDFASQDLINIKN